jgi:hypothetical protein
MGPKREQLSPSGSRGRGKGPMFKQYLAIGTITSDSPRRAATWQPVASRVSPSLRPSVSLVDGAFGTSSLAVPSSSERADLRSPWAARFDEQRGRLQAPRGPSRLRRLSRPRLLVSPTSPRPFATFRTSGPATSSRGAVIGATSSRRPEPAGLADPERSKRVDGGPGAQSPPVCRSGAARLADIPAVVAVSACATTVATGTPTDLQATTAALATPRPKPIGCGPESESTNRIQSAHNRKD